MPKESIEIKTFHNGMQSAPDAHDIPLDAASYSLNLEQIGEDGSLRGVPSDKVLNKEGGWDTNLTGVYSISHSAGGNGEG